MKNTIIIHFLFILFFYVAKADTIPQYWVESCHFSSSCDSIYLTNIFFFSKTGEVRCIECPNGLSNKNDTLFISSELEFAVTKGNWIQRNDTLFICRKLICSRYMFRWEKVIKKNKEYLKTTKLPEQYNDTMIIAKELNLITSKDGINLKPFEGFISYKDSLLFYPDITKVGCHHQIDTAK